MPCPTRVFSVRLTYAAIAILCCAVLGGCATGEKFSKIEDVPPGQGVVYVYRPPAYAGCGVLPVIEINGEQLGRLKSGGYMYSLVPAGRTEVYTVTETPASLIVEVSDGGHHYVREHINMGFWIGRPALQEFKESRAMREISRCHLDQKQMAKASLEDQAE